MARRGFELNEWVTPQGVVLAVSGDLDARACLRVDQHVRRLLMRWPALLLTLDLSQVGKVELPAAETLILDVVALRAGEARLAFAADGGACQGLLTRLGAAAPIPAVGFSVWIERLAIYGGGQ